MRDADRLPLAQDHEILYVSSLFALAVMTATKQECSIYHRVTVTQASGYLSSHVTQETGIGSLECPWVLRAQPGQRVRIVLLDFFGASQTVVCHVYAIVKDQGEFRQFAELAKQTTVKCLKRTGTKKTKQHGSNEVACSCLQTNCTG